MFTDQIEALTNEQLEAYFEYEETCENLDALAEIDDFDFA